MVREPLQNLSSCFQRAASTVGQPLKEHAVAAGEEGYSPAAYILVRRICVAKGNKVCMGIIVHARYKTQKSYTIKTFKSYFSNQIYLS